MSELVDICMTTLVTQNLSGRLPASGSVIGHGSDECRKDSVCVYPVVGEWRSAFGGGGIV